MSKRTRACAESPPTTPTKRNVNKQPCAPGTVVAESKGTVRVLRRGPRAHDGPCGHCRICGKEPDESSMTHPKEGSLKSLNELLMRKNIVPEHDPVRRGQCLCTSVNCGYHMWRHRFEEGKNHTPPNASTTEAASRPPPRAVWDKCYNADTDRVGKHRCLTHLRVVEALLQHVLIEASASVLDCCGGMHDAVAVALRARGCQVVTNDIVHSRKSDHHIDATSSAFLDVFSGTNAVDWVISSPPYDTDSAVSIIKNAIAVAKHGVCMKVRLSFLEPCKSRLKFHVENPVSLCVVLPRLTYGSRRSRSSECWLVWQKSAAYSQPIVYGMTE